MPNTTERSKQSKRILGLWRHKWRPITFTLVVNNFGVKYNRKEHAKHLVASLEAAKYRVKTDWKGKKYIDITLYWDYRNARFTSLCRGTKKKG